MGNVGLLSPPVQKLLRLAAGTMGRLYGAGKICYRSQSPRRQIDDSGQVANINRLRRLYGGGGMGPLTSAQ